MKAGGPPTTREFGLSLRLPPNETAVA